MHGDGFLWKRCGTRTLRAQANRAFRRRIRSCSMKLPVSTGSNLPLRLPALAAVQRPQAKEATNHKGRKPTTQGNDERCLRSRWVLEQRSDKKAWARTHLSLPCSVTQVVSERNRQFRRSQLSQIEAIRP